MVDERLIVAFWRNYQLSQGTSPEDRVAREESLWALEGVERATREPSAETIELLVALAEAAPDDPARYYLGVGPVRDFIVCHGRDFIDEIEQAAIEHEGFRTTLECVFYATSMDRVVVERLQALFTR